MVELDTKEKVVPAPMRFEEALRKLVEMFPKKFVGNSGDGFWLSSNGKFIYYDSPVFPITQNDIDLILEEIGWLYFVHPIFTDDNRSNMWWIASIWEIKYGGDFYSEKGNHFQEVDRRRCLENSKLEASKQSLITIVEKLQNVVS